LLFRAKFLRMLIAKLISWRLEIAFSLLQTFRMQSPVNETTLQLSLENFSETALLRDVLGPLLSTMGFADVQIAGGQFESGKDIVCWKLDELGQRQVFVVVVKRLKAIQLSSSAMSSTVAQFQMALKTPIYIDDKPYEPDGLIFITPYQVNTKLLASRLHRFFPKKRLQILDGASLGALVAAHLPNLAGKLSGQSEASEESQGMKHDKRNLLVSDEKPSLPALDYLTGLFHDLKTFLDSEEPIDPTLCFVIMSFSGNPQLADFYEKAVKPTVTRLGYRCERVDEQQFNGSITERILRNIRLAKFVIADLTEARPNCYYELGVAHALRKEVIHISNSVEHIHFDVKHFNFILYKRIDDLRQALKKRILGTIGEP
jgi:hypothetical protein